MATKEIRNGNLIAIIKTRLPNVGFIHLDTKSAGRRAFVTFRGLDFLVSSKLTVKEMGFGRNMPKKINETENSALLQEHLRV